jgi:hypothetical protein
MKDYFLTMEAIQEYYDILNIDDDVKELQMYRPILQAAEEVLRAEPAQPMPHSLDLVQYALIGALHELENLRKGWEQMGIR